MDYLDQEYLEKLSEESWLDESEGQLSVDVFETENEIIIRSAIAGITVDDLEISATDDSITIRGTREECAKKIHGVAHIEECHWGKFSRSIVLPSKVLPEKTDAVLKNGILTITLKKAEMHNQIPVLEIE